jgi:hypothetical protein
MNFGFASEKDKVRSAFPEYFPKPLKRPIFDQKVHFRVLCVLALETACDCSNGPSKSR